MLKPIAVSLFDVSGVMLQPWADDGYECWIVDTQHPSAYASSGVTSDGNFMKVHWDLTKPWLCPFDRHRIKFVSAFPPCDHLAVSGSQWFRGKGLRLLSKSIEMFATAAEFCEWAEAPYLIENPVSTIASHWRKPDHYFSPYFYTAYAEDDNYTKRTCLWVGNGFKMPPHLRALGLPDPDDRIHKMPPSVDRKNLRSKTPLGFAKAVFLSNARSPRKTLM